MAKILPDIRARLRERFVINFRVDPDVLQRRLPDWLAPQLIDGAAVASYCLLDLDQVTFGPVPDKLGVRNRNCAQRYGIIDTRSGEPCVYVAERNTDSRLGSFITGLGFPGHHPRLDVAMDAVDDGWRIEVGDGGATPLFAARLQPASETRSTLFPSTDAFAAFLAGGVRSYCPATDAAKLNVVDMHKQDTHYEPLVAVDIEDRIVRDWLELDGPLAFDSAFRTVGGSYIWSYHGQAQR
ncbi:MAG: DUF2071 domain-containing protein [Planctomycetota bacterium]